MADHENVEGIDHVNRPFQGEARVGENAKAAFGRLQGLGVTTGRVKNRGSTPGWPSRMVRSVSA